MRKSLRTLAESFGRRPPRQEPLAEPVCTLLKELPSSKYGNHPVQDYITALEDSGFRAKGIIDKGYDSMVFEAEGGSVLKVTWLHLEPAFGKRPFDAPIIGSGVIELGRRGLFVKRVSFFMQPKVEMRATDADSAAFRRMAEALGYEFQDPGPHQLGFHDGGLVLVDPFAVRRKGQGHWSDGRMPYYNFG